MPDSRPKRFFDLGFYPGTAEPSKELPLGGKKGNVGLKNPSGRAPKNIGLRNFSSPSSGYSGACLASAEPHIGRIRSIRCHLFRLVPRVDATAKQVSTRAGRCSDCRSVRLWILFGSCQGLDLSLVQRDATAIARDALTSLSPTAGPPPVSSWFKVDR
jgi:hypothetical protein